MQSAAGWGEEGSRSPIEHLRHPRNLSPTENHNTGNKNSISYPFQTHAFIMCVPFFFPSIFVILLIGPPPFYPPP